METVQEVLEVPRYGQELIRVIKPRSEVQEGIRTRLRFNIETLNVVENWEFWTRIEVLILVVIVDEPSSA